MSLKARVVLSFLLIACCAARGHTQEVRSYMRPIDSLSSAGAGSFSSTAGRYTISLPKRVGGFREGNFEWRLTEGFYAVGHTDAGRDFGGPKDAEHAARGLAEAALDGLNEDLLVSPVTPTRQTHRALKGSAGGLAGFELRAEYPNGLAIVRTLFDGRRAYTLAVMLVGEQRAHESRALAVFDSFRVTPEEDADAALRARIEAATPKPLPQEPVAPKLKSDAEDEGLKGKVKSIIEESERPSSRTGLKGARRRSSESHFNERGNLVKKILYDSQGQPIHITVYGYVGGSRVAHSGSMRSESSPPPIAVAPSAAAAATAPPRDTRYGTRHDYRYDDEGRLSEELIYGNDGALLSRVVYKREGERVEELRYSMDGSLSMRTLLVLDEKGNKKEETHFDWPFKGGQTVYRHTYEFDARGNWVKRTTTETRASGDRSEAGSVNVLHRIITYY